MNRLKLVFLALGLVFLVVVVQRVGFGPFVDAVERVGFWFVPIFCMNILWYLSDAVGLSFVVAGHTFGLRPGLGRVLVAQVCGEAINNATPLMNLGGEPVKGLMLGERISGPSVVGALVVDNTIKYLATVAFVGVGFTLSLLFVDLPRELRWSLGVGLATLAAVLVIVVAVQTRGFLSRLVSVTSWLPARVRPSDRYRETARAVDDAMVRFYLEHRHEFAASFLFHTISRLLATADAFLVLWLLDVDATLLTALFIVSTSILINLVFSFIPLAMGASEGGHYLVFSALGLAPETGVVFALIGRVRGLVWIAIGLGLLAVHLRGQRSLVSRRETP